MASKPTALIVAGDGINCEYETARAFSIAHAKTKIVHLNELIQNKKILEQAQILAIPGGFSFGDELGSGQICALKIRHGLIDELMAFIDQGNPVIGICNGMQVLAKLGVLPFFNRPGQMALAPNKNHYFINKWVELDVNQESRCLWANRIDSRAFMAMPIRHGEGRVVFSDSSLKKEVIDKNLYVFRYLEDVNGSDYHIAGVCNEKGNVLGLMPHPEACVSPFQFPYQPAQEVVPLGLEMFKNAVRYWQ